MAFYLWIGSAYSQNLSPTDSICSGVGAVILTTTSFAYASAEEPITVQYA